MQTNTRKINQYAKWQYLVLVVTLVIMALSALPNWYGERAVVALTSNSDVTQLDLTNIKQSLAAAHIDLDRVTVHQDKALFYPSRSEERFALQTKLKALLPETYNATLDMESAAPAWLSNMGLEPVKLGLDLQGGVRFILNVDTDIVIKERFAQILNESKRLIRAERIYGASAKVISPGTIELNFPEDKYAAVAKVKRQLQTLYPQLTFNTQSRTGMTINLSEKGQNALANELVVQNLHTLRDRIEELGITEASIQRKGKHQIRIELPGVQDPSEARRVIGATAALDFYPMTTSGGRVLHSEDGRPIRIASTAILSGKHIKDARAGSDEYGLPDVRLHLDERGGKAMTAFSAKNVGKPIVTVLTDYTKDKQGRTVKTAKIINIATITSVLGSQFSITHMQSPQSARELALLLRAGSLTAPVTIEAQSAIGPTLGQENIFNGLAALALGLGIILTFMTLWYRRLGLVANLSLLLNLICLLGLMSLIPGIVLTLPGIAGLVLTVGMAVDTNVLIFERIKEESQKGRSPQMAVHYGYSNAFATILDANITTLMTAMILYSVGYGPVKGFAITLGLGILTSMFTGIFASRAITNLSLTKSNRLLKGVLA